MTTRARALVVLLAAAPLGAQEEERPKPVFGVNTAVGLGGSAGGVYGLRTTGLRRFAHREPEAAECLEDLLVGLGERPSWRGSAEQPDAATIEAVAWAGLALCSSSTMRSGEHNTVTKAVALDLLSLVGGDGELLLPEAAADDLRLRALVCWSLAENGVTARYRILTRRLGPLAEALAAHQFEDGSLPSRVGGEVGDPGTTAIALHVWRTVGHDDAPSDAVAAAAERAEAWLAAAAEDSVACRLLQREQQLLRRSLDREQIQALETELAGIEESDRAAWFDRPELELAWLTVTAAHAGPRWDAAWDAVCAAAQALPSDSVPLREQALAALRLSTTFRYATLSVR